MEKLKWERRTIQLPGVIKQISGSTVFECCGGLAIYRADNGWNDPWNVLHIVSGRSAGWFTGRPRARKAVELLLPLADWRQDEKTILAGVDISACRAAIEKAQRWPERR